MYIALVLACWYSDPSYCRVLEDQRGPYSSYEQCQTRALEMSKDVHRHMQGYKAVQWKCKSVVKGQLTTPW
jgi:hypothetical protein